MLVSSSIPYPFIFFCPINQYRVFHFFVYMLSCINILLSSQSPVIKPLLSSFLLFKHPPYITLIKLSKERTCAKKGFIFELIRHHNRTLNRLTGTYSQLPLHCANPLIIKKSINSDSALYSYLLHNA